MIQPRSQGLSSNEVANDLAMAVCRSISVPQSFKDQHTLGLARYACKASFHASNIEP